MAIRLISIDRRKSLAVYEQDGIQRVIKARFDDADNPILDSKTEAELQKLFDAAKKIAIPDTPFARAIPVTTIVLR